MRVLLIEDDEVLGEAVRDHIAALGHAVDWARSRSDAEDHLAAASYGLLLLDLGLPDGRGMDLLKALRRNGDQTPVIIATARDRLAERIDGLNAGADDYLVKPYDLGELTARIAAVARRYGGIPNPLLRIGGVTVDRANRRVFLDEVESTLSAREWVVLEELAARPGATVPKRQIEDALYAFGMEVESNTIEVYVSRLRRKIGAEAVVTVRGVGYRLAGS